MLKYNILQLEKDRSTTKYIHGSCIISILLGKSHYLWSDISRCSASRKQEFFIGRQSWETEISYH